MAHGGLPPPPVRGVGAVLRHSMPFVRKDHSDIVNTGTCTFVPSFGKERIPYVRYGDVGSSVSAGGFFLIPNGGSWLWAALARA